MAKTKPIRDAAQLECKGIIKTVRFYNPESYYAILVIEVVDTLNMKPNTIFYNPDFTKNIIVTGTVFDPQVDEEVVVTGNPVRHDVYGPQYEIDVIDRNFGDIKTEEGKKEFMCKVFTPLQVENLYAAIDDPFEAFEEENYDALLQVHGVGMTTLQHMVNKFHKHKGAYQIYAQLPEYGLSEFAIDSLLSKYNSYELIIKILKENPYRIILDRIPGLGWKRVDALAEKGGMDPNDHRRIMGFIYYYLMNLAEEGDSYITVEELQGGINEYLGAKTNPVKISEALRELEKENKLWCNKDHTLVGDMYYYELEDNIAKELIRIKDGQNEFDYEGWEERVKRLEEAQGFEFTEEQWSTIEAATKEQVLFITGKAGCVDCDTEFFNGKEWKRIADYKKGDKVLQYHHFDGKAELVEPLAYIKQPSEMLYHFHTKYGLDQVLSKNHNVFYVTKNGQEYIEPFSAVKEKIDDFRFYGKFVTTFNYDGNGIDLSDDEIRLCVAVFADGTFLRRMSPDGYTVRLHMKKARKKKRLEQLLKNLNMPYKKKQSAADGYHDYYFFSPVTGKNFPVEWYNCSSHQKQIIIDEVMKWDGDSKRENKYSTKSKSDADFIQFVYSSLGYRASIYAVDRTGKEFIVDDKAYTRHHIEYSVAVTKKRRNTCGLCQGKNGRTQRKGVSYVKEYKPMDGYEYCFTVPSHLLVLRRNNKIFITGNCGKSTTVAGILAAIKGNIEYAQMALAGRAAARLTEVTHREGMTIHRALNYTPQVGWGFNQEVQAPYDLIILDEVSMLSADIFYYLTRAIKTGAKLIMLGDIAQLPPIGCGNIAHDLLSSPYIPTMRLNKIHRQAQQSAIVTESIKISNGQYITSKNWTGKDVRGILQDLRLDVYSSSSNTFYRVIEHFNTALEQGVPLDDIQIILPVKVRGDASVFNVNNTVQELVNPANGQREIDANYEKDKIYTLREGDRVVNRVNNYEAQKWLGYEKEHFDRLTGEYVTECVPVYNGNIGTIKHIYPKEKIVVIDFKGIGTLAIQRGNINALQLGYAITCHSAQGSEMDYVIIGLDNLAWTMLSRQWVYTAITRAKKVCVLCCEASALARATTYNDIIIKRTHLQERIKEVVDPSF